MTLRTGLGEFLRTRRGRVRPQDVGLPAGPRRRVAGLRREEVALLAGISVEYYLRLEQGRDRHPSDQVVSSLGVALRLEPDEVAYLHELARPARPAEAETGGAGPVGPGVAGLIASWPTTPALVHDRTMTTLAANPLATALSPFFAPGVNSLRAAFLEPEMRAFYQDWDEVTAKAVAYLRAVAGAGTDAPGLAGLVAELNARSERFRTLWALQDVRQKTSGTSRMRHPVVGPLELHYEKLALPGTPGHMLITYHARPGTPTHERLTELARLAAAAGRPADATPPRR